LKTVLSELDFIVASVSKGTVFWGVAVRSSACEAESNLFFECLRNSVGKIAIVQNRKEHQLGNFTLLFYKELC
jgi:hypothetical protein